MAPAPPRVAILPVRRVLLVGLAGCALAAVLAGLVRLGIAVPSANPMDHGPLLVLGVLASVIALERAVALGRLWAYAAPGLGALGALAQLGGQHTPGALLALAGVGVLLGVNAAVVKRQSASFTWLMLLGSALLFAGTAAWVHGAPVFVVVPTWLGFFALTIVAERLELSRLVRTPHWATPVLLAVCALACVAAGAALWRTEPAVRLFGAALVGVAGWELRFDLAFRTVRTSGLPRFAAVGVLAGASWLGLGGAGLAAFGLPAAGPVYDAVVHAVFVGFVLSMVFAHAPIIFPAVARVEVPFHPVLYLPLALLHLALVARVVGDLVPAPSLRQAGGLGNAVALALFFAAVLVARWSRRAGAETVS